MKILISADWHIKLGTKKIPDHWASNRYRLLFLKLHDLENQVDKHFILGDIFDKLPRMEELELYFDFISKCSVPTIIIPGNHEAIKKDTTFLSFLKNSTSAINSNVKIIDDYYQEDNIDFIPYNKLKDTWPSSLSNKILCTHCRGDILPHVKSEIDLELFNRWEVVLAGDLHSYSNSQRNILYPGSPLTTSFHRSKVETGVIKFDTSNLQHEWLKLDLPQLIRKTIQAGEPMPQTEYDHTIYEVEGEMSSLAQMEESGLLDKKVVRRSSDTTLILDPDMTIAQELEEYLRYVLELPDSTVVEVLKDFNNE